MAGCPEACLKNPLLAERQAVSPEVVWCVGGVGGVVWCVGGVGGVVWCVGGVGGVSGVSGVGGMGGVR